MITYYLIRTLINTINMKTFQDSVESREKIIECLSSGEVVIMPSNGVYTINTNLFNERAIKKLYMMKEKDTIKAMSVYVYDWAMARVLTNLNEEETKIIEIITQKFWPGPLTIIVGSNESYVSSYYISEHTISLECPDHEIPRYVLKYNEMPLLVTTANTVNNIHSVCGEHINKYFGTISDITFINSDTVPKYGIRNTIIKIKDKNITFIRHGIITEEDVRNECELHELDVVIDTELLVSPNYENSKIAVLGKFIQGDPIDKTIEIENLDRSIELYLNNSVFVDLGKRNTNIKEFCTGYVDLSEGDNIKEALFNINNVLHQLKDIQCKNVIFFNFYKSKEGLYKTLYNIILRYCNHKEIFIPLSRGFLSHKELVDF